MSDFDYTNERIARQQIAERVQTMQRSAVPGRRRRRLTRRFVPDTPWKMGGK